MSARFLAWYTCGVLSLASLLLLFISVAPGAQSRFAALQAILGGAALSFAVVAVVLMKLPREHWGNRSFAVRFLLSLAAITSSMLVAVSVGQVPPNNGVALAWPSITVFRGITFLAAGPVSDRYRQTKTSERFLGAHWTDSFSHGELLRAVHDERLEVDPANMRFLFQGVSLPPRFA